MYFGYSAFNNFILENNGNKLLIKEGIMFLEGNIKDIAWLLITLPSRYDSEYIILNNTIIVEAEPLSLKLTGCKNNKKINASLFGNLKAAFEELKPMVIFQ